MKRNTTIPGNIQPAALRCEYLENPIGLDERQPRLSWFLTSDRRSQRQLAYQVLVAGSEAALQTNKGDLWDSGRVESSQSVHIVYAGRPLRSEMQCWWKVRVWNGDGEVSAYSPPAFWQMGLLEAADWQGQWIGFDTGPINDLRWQEPELTAEEIAARVETACDTGGSFEIPRKPIPIEDSVLRPSPYLRQTFTLARPVRRATLYATARGLYEAHLNGKRVDDSLLTPGWTDYRRRIEYQTYDVTAMLQSGENAIGALLADGWYAGYLGPFHERDYYGVRPTFIAQLNIELADGSRRTIVTDGTWKASAGPLRSAELYHGETYDATQELPDWTLPGYDDGGWQPVLVVNEPVVALTAQHSPPIRVTEELTPMAVTEPTSGTFIFDMGQNMVGWARLRVTGAAGTRVQLRFSESINGDGALQTANLGHARATDVYILKGEELEIFEPRFTYHGFRYVELTGYPGEPVLDAITGCVVHADLPMAGDFSCSNPTVNKLFKNILWGQRGNFSSVPTDCPQRAERLGWTGDMFVFAVTGALNMDAAAYYTRWMRIVAEAQAANGAFSDIAPRVVFPTHGAPVWGDVGVFLPWMMYRLYGDRRIIETYYEAMSRWMTYIGEANPAFLRLKRRNYDWGDWVSYNADTPTEALATAVWALDARLMAQMAGAIGQTEDVERYEALFENIKAAFVEAYVSSEGRVYGETQTGYVLALYAGLIPGELRAAAAQHLVADIKARGWRLSTGFVGTAFLLPVLSDMGRSDIAYRLLNQETCPSWGYMIKQGATTIWERWDADVEMQRILGDVSSEPTFVHHRFGEMKNMNSFNHFALGAVGEWLYRYVAGIDAAPDHPGYEHILIRPRTGGGITHVKGSYRSIRGLITSEWENSAGRFRLNVSIPANTTATVYVPASDSSTVTEGGRPAGDADGVEWFRVEDGTTVFHIGSGTYQFESQCH